MDSLKDIALLVTALGTFCTGLAALVSASRGKGQSRGNGQSRSSRSGESQEADGTAVDHRQGNPQSGPPDGKFLD